MLKMSLLLALALPSVASAQEAASSAVLAANSEVPLVLDREVSSKHMRVGDLFDVSVARDVWVGTQLAIPRGTHGRGVVTWKTGKGAFGKSGKMEIELRSLQLAGRTVPISGKYRQEGQGNTAATVGTVLAAGVLAGMFVTGHSAVFAQGTELRGYTAAPLAAEPAPSPSPVFAAATTAPPVAVANAVVVPAIASPSASRQQATPTRTAYVVVPVAPAIVPAGPVIAPVAVASVVPAATLFAKPASYARTAPMVAAPTGDDPNRLARLLAAQRGVHGRDARQGWTISD